MKWVGLFIVVVLAMALSDIVGDILFGATCEVMFG